jgi:hypothetical protein
LRAISVQWYFRTADGYRRLFAAADGSGGDRDRGVDDVGVASHPRDRLADALEAANGQAELPAQPRIRARGEHRGPAAPHAIGRQHDGPAGGKLFHQHFPALPRAFRAADDRIQRHEHVLAAGRSVLKRDVQRKVAPTGFHARQAGWNECRGNAVFVLFADQVIGVVELEGEPQHRGDGRQRDIALVPVQADTDDLLAVELSFADHAAVGDGRGV